MKVIHLISGGDTGGARTHVHLLLKHLNIGGEATLVCFMDGPFARDAAALGIPTVVMEDSMPAVLKKLRTMIRGESPIGRKIDFLIQEFNREANTIGSKASDTVIAQHVVDLKSEIEKLREQIQNVE